MSSLIDSIAQAFPSDAIGQIAKVADLKPDFVGKGLNVIGPLVTGALAAKAATPGGLSSLMNMLPSGKGDTGLGVGDLLGYLKPGAAKETLNGIFGSGTSAVGGVLDRTLGFRASPLLALVAPVALGAISKAVNTSKLGPGGVARMLEDESREYLNKGGEHVTVVRQALDAGRQAAAIKERFSTSEWEAVRLGPVAAAQAVMMASPSGLVGSVKEVGSVLEAFREGRRDAAPASLLNVAFDDDPSKEEFVAVVKDRTPAAVLDLVRGAVNTVSQRDPSAVGSYKAFILSTAQRVAEASKEGGFLGIGGKQVSGDEQATLDRIRTLLA